MLGITPILQKHLESEYSLNKTAAGFGASLVGGASCAVLSCPTDVIKTCMQGDLERKKYGSLTSTIRTISKQGYAAVCDQRAPLLLPARSASECHLLCALISRVPATVDWHQAPLSRTPS